MVFLEKGGWYSWGRTLDPLDPARAVRAVYAHEWLSGSLSVEFFFLEFSWSSLGVLLEF